MRYRTLNCVECGSEFLERNNDELYRLNDDSQPNEVAISASTIMAMCGNCMQQYHVNISLSVAVDNNSVALYLQPESMYLAIEHAKKLRFLHCMECGKPFHSLSDRVSQVIDNRVPFEYVDPSRLGPLEARCTSGRCKQAWALIVG
jgi:transcription elongation factor Elf1